LDKLNKKNNPPTHGGKTVPPVHQDGIAANLQERLNKLSLMVYLAAGDLEIHETESKLIIEIGTKLGFLPEETAEIIQSPSDFLHVVIPERKREKLSLIYDLLYLMLADGKVTVEEVAIISKISFLFGIPAIKLKTFYIQLVEAGNKGISKEEFLHTMEIFV